MNSEVKPLPDVAFEQAQYQRPLNWVGMANVALPVIWEGVTMAANVDVFVNLTDADARGIHMSRLYLQIQDAFASSELTRELLEGVLRNLVDTQEGSSDAARLVFRFDALLSREALASDNKGWRRYPVTLDTSWSVADGFRWNLKFPVTYSSTCPASAALSRRANAEHFESTFGPRTEALVADIGAWIAGPSALAATPHAQRSNAWVDVDLSTSLSSLPMRSLLDALELALATVVQTAVKREDEQAFARLNAANLMFCEDASRRVAAVLSSRDDVVRFNAKVEHLESLHAHDAVAYVSGAGRAEN